VSISSVACPGQTDTELLDQRGAQVAVAFDAIRARPRRLDSVEIAELPYTCWCPERARRQPLQIWRRLPDAAMQYSISFAELMDLVRQRDFDAADRLP